MELNFDEERERLQAVRTDLLNRVTAIDSALEALVSNVNGAVPQTRGRKAATASAAELPAGRRPMSAKARKAARERMLAYWAARRKAAKTK